MRDDRTAELLTTLKGEVSKLTDSDQWKNWLGTVAKFHNYSFNNQLLIAWQKPEATRVAGYQAWQDLGRQVRKGEHGIKILAPIIRKVEDDNGEEVRRCVGFRGVSVFDISQTDGDPLPELVVPGVTLEDDGELFASLVDIAGRNGLTVQHVPTADGNVRGWYTPSKKEITIVDSYPVASRTRTVLHELGHHFTPDLDKLSRSEKELIAESAAYVVGTQLGIDTAEYSAFYTANWSDGNVDRIEAVAGAVLTTARSLSEAVGLEDK